MTPRRTQALVKFGRACRCAFPTVLLRFCAAKRSSGDGGSLGSASPAKLDHYQTQRISA